jgi:hypothetical protein
MATTYTLISSVTVGSGGAANIEFTSIPATYTDLVLVHSLRATNSSSARSEDTLLIRINGDSTGANYTIRYLSGNGASASSGTVTSGYNGAYAGDFNGSTSTANTFANGSFYIPNYAGSNQKSYSADMVQEANATTAYMSLQAGLYNQTTAITSLTLIDHNSNNFAQYSTTYLYGISNA